MSAPNDGSGTTPQDDADKIRLKRLARLQLGQPAASSSSASPSQSHSPASTSRPATPAKQAQESGTPKPAQQQQQQVVAKPPTAPKSFQSPTSVTTSLSAKASAPARPAEPFVQWESRAIGNILKVTLDRNYAEWTGWTIAYLKPLLLELQSERPPDSPPPRLTRDILDRLLIARLSLDPDEMNDDGEMLTVIASLPERETVFEYLVGAWKTTRQEMVALGRKGYSPEEIKQGSAMLDQLRMLILSYAGLTLQDPTMFPQPQNKSLGAAELLPLLIPPLMPSDPLSSTAPPSLPPAFEGVSPPEFLADLVRRWEDDGLMDVLGPVVKLICAQAKAVDLAGTRWRSLISAVEMLVQNKSIAHMFTELDNWLPDNITAPQIEMDSLLGPLVRLSVFSASFSNIGTEFFADASLNRAEQNEATFRSLRATLESLQASLFNVFNSIVRSSPIARERVLKYFGTVARLNTRRGGMRFDPRRVSSDGFMINLQVVLDRFATPFMDAGYTKLDKIDVEYFKNSDRIDINEETKIKANKEESDAFYEGSQSATPPNFISEIFFLSLTFQHLGYHATQRWSSSMAKQADHMEKQLAQQRDAILSEPRFQPGQPGHVFAQAQIKKHENDLQVLKAAVVSTRVQVEDPTLMSRMLGSYLFTATWFVNVVDPTHQHPKKMIFLPLPLDLPVPWRMLPEYIIEDTVDFFKIVLRHAPNLFEGASKDDFFVFCLTFLTSPWYIGNPYTRNKVVELLWYGSFPYGYNRLGVLGDMINFHPLSLPHLMSSLLTFYIDVERTGVSSQFYDRLNVRYNIARLLKVVWNNPTHRDKLREFAKDIDKFIKFTNLLLNDSTLLLDDALGKLKKVHELEEAMADQAAWNARPEDERHRLEDELEQTGQHAQSYIQLGNESVKLLVAFTAEAKEAFMMPEIVDRLAAMLDYNLRQLAGPQLQELKVSNPDKYGWRPKVLLGDILQVFINLEERPEFMSAIAKDGRSYSRELFERAAGIALRRGVKTEQEIAVLRMLVDKVEKVRIEMEEEDEEDMPDEFLDTILSTLMRNPVILPTSKMVVDRSTINAHLLSDATDPFNRSPLKIEDVIPHTELKEKIDAFIAERRARRAAASASGT